MKFTKSLIASAALAALVACGGGGGSENPAPVTGTQTGVFTDAAIVGASYTTTSGVTGSTNPAGEFSFNANDDVTFRIGDLVLGEVTAKEILTPVDLAAGNQDKLDNLLVILQSLDSDGDPDNGITIPAAASLPATLNLETVSEADLTTALTTARTNANIIQGEVKTVTQARDHFIGQASALLAANIWTVHIPEENSWMALQVNPNGDYLFGEYTPTEGLESGFSGVEAGRMTAVAVDVHGFQVESAVAVDTNGTWGFSDATNLVNDRLIISGSELVFTSLTPEKVVDATTKFTKAANNNSNFVGAWALRDDAGEVVPGIMFVFFPDGKVLVSDAMDKAVDDCSQDGIELGDYTYNAATRELTFASAPTIDTNGCGGLWDEASLSPDLVVTLAADGMTAKLDDVFEGEPETVTFVRISK